MSMNDYYTTNARYLSPSKEFPIKYKLNFENLLVEYLGAYSRLSVKSNNMGISIMSINQFAKFPESSFIATIVDTHKKDAKIRTIEITAIRQVSFDFSIISNGDCDSVAHIICGKIADTKPSMSSNGNIITLYQ